MTHQERKRTNRKTARIIGVLFLAATATYMAGTGLIDTVLRTPDYLLHVYPNRIQVIVGVLLQFVNCTAVASIGVLLFPIVKKHSEPVALGYLVTRILECTFLAVGGIGTLALVALSQETLQAGASDAAYSLPLGNLLVTGSHMAYLVGMGVLGLGSLPLCYVLYRSRLIPRSLALLGLIGYAALLIGSLLEIFGFDLNLVHYLPGGLFELILPIWLIGKGFNSSTIAFESAKTDVNQRDRMSLSKA